LPVLKRPGKGKKQNLAFFKKTKEEKTINIVHNSCILKEKKHTRLAAAKKHQTPFSPPYAFHGLTPIKKPLSPLPHSAHQPFFVYFRHIHPQET